MTLRTVNADDSGAAIPDDGQRIESLSTSPSVAASPSADTPSESSAKKPRKRQATIEDDGDFEPAAAKKRAPRKRVKT